MPGFTRWLAFTVTVMACSSPDARSGVRSDSLPLSRRLATPPTFASLMDTTQWLVYSGDGFTMKIPPGGHVAPTPVTSGGWRRASVTWRWSEFPTLTVDLASMPPRPGHSLSQYIDSVRREENRVADPPYWKTGPASPVHLGSIDALELNPPCGDCQPVELYISLQYAWVEFAYTPGLGTPYTEEEQDSLYRTMAGTVRSR
jgi:hypothetical protein